MPVTSTQRKLNDALESISSVQEVLQNAYAPEASREKIAAAVGKALSELEEYGDEESDDSSDD